MRDEQGRPVGRIRQTLKLTPEGGTKQVLYQSGLSLPPGRFSAKVVVRDNASGAVGSFETGVFVPDLRRAPVKVSSVTLSTQLRPVEGRQRSESPLVREGVEILPSLTHVVDRAQKMLLYYEVRARGARRRHVVDQDEPGVLPRRGEGVRDAARGTHRARRGRPPRGHLSVRGARVRISARPLYLPGQHHRRRRRPLRVSTARALYPLSQASHLTHSKRAGSLSETDAT